MMAGPFALSSTIFAVAAGQRSVIVRIAARESHHCHVRGLDEKSVLNLVCRLASLCRVYHLAPNRAPLATEPTLSNGNKREGPKDV
jgi:hypothetical protein